MRPSQKTGRSRGKSNRSRGGGGGGVGHSPNRVYESAGPEGKVRGTPQQVIDKYLSLARDSQLSGDRVTAENFLQHAEHYVRILIAAQEAANADRRDQNQQQGGGERDEQDGGDANGARAGHAGGRNGGQFGDDDGDQPDQGRGQQGRRDGGARAENRETGGRDNAERAPRPAAPPADEQPPADGLAAIGDAERAPEIVETPESQVKPVERRPRRARPKTPKPAADKAEEPSAEAAK